MIKKNITSSNDKKPMNAVTYAKLSIEHFIIAATRAALRFCVCDRFGQYPILNFKLIISAAQREIRKCIAPTVRRFAFFARGRRKYTAFICRFGLDFKAKLCKLQTYLCKIHKNKMEI